MRGCVIQADLTDESFRVSSWSLTERQNFFAAGNLRSSEPVQVGNTSFRCGPVYGSFRPEYSTGGPSLSMLMCG